MMSEVEHLSRCFLAICVSSLQKCLLRSSGNSWVRLFDFFWLLLLLTHGDCIQSSGSGGVIPFKICPQAMLMLQGHGSCKHRLFRFSLGFGCCWKHSWCHSPDWSHLTCAHVHGRPSRGAPWCCAPESLQSLLTCPSWPQTSHAHSYPAAFLTS